MVGIGMGYGLSMESTEELKKCFLEKQDKKLSQENWRKCLKLAEGREINTEEEQWLYEARKKLK